MLNTHQGLGKYFIITEFPIVHALTFTHSITHSLTLSLYLSHTHSDTHPHTCTYMYAQDNIIPGIQRWWYIPDLEWMVYHLLHYPVLGWCLNLYVEAGCKFMPAQHPPSNFQACDHLMVSAALLETWNWGGTWAVRIHQHFLTLGTLLRIFGAVVVQMLI